MAARSENPRKSLPRAIAGTLFGAALFSTLAQLALAVSVDDDTNDDDFSFERSFRQKGWSWAKYTAEIGELILLPLVVLLAFMPTPELLAAISLDGLLLSGNQIIQQTQLRGRHVDGVGARHLISTQA